MSIGIGEDEDTKFADELDRAAFIAERATSAAVDDARWKAAPGQIRNEDGTWPQPQCACGEDIEPERLGYGMIRCYGCQVTLEKKGKQYARK